MPRGSSLLHQLLSPAQNVMLTVQIVLTGIAALASLLGMAALRKQSQAKTCPVHSRCVGVIATLLAYLLFVGSLCLLVYTWYFLHNVSPG